LLAGVVALQIDDRAAAATMRPAQRLGEPELEPQLAEPSR
jgi:hypothetical protein